MMALRWSVLWAAAACVVGGVALMAAGGDAPQAVEEKVRRWVAQDERDETQFTLMGTEMVVADVETSLDFYRKCGFTMGGHGPPDPATGKITNASMHGGVARLVFLQGPTSDADRAARKKMVLTFYVRGGPPALSAHRDKLRASGLKVGDFSDKGSLRRYAVEDPDGYVLLFNTNIQPGGPQGAKRVPAK